MRICRRCGGLSCLRGICQTNVVARAAMYVDPTAVLRVFRSVT